MAQAPALEPTPDSDRFIRATRLLIKGGTPIVRGLFNNIHPPSLLANVLKNQHKKKLESLKRHITQPEWNKLFPSSTSCGESNTFDITLLFKLLRNICNLTEPTTGWDKLPNGADECLEADLARIKYYRNEVYAHASEMEITENDFDVYWDEISHALLRILKSYDPNSVRKWQTEIEKLHTGPISAEDKKIWLAELPGMIVQCSINVSHYVGDVASYLFNQFRGLDLQQLMVVVQDAILPWSGVIVEDIRQGSVMILLRVKDVSALEDLWERYENGELKVELERVLITDEIRKLGENVELTVTMSEEEYFNARNFFEELILHKRKKGKSVAETKETKEVRERLEDLSLDIVHGETIADRGSEFQAHFAEVTSKDQIDKVLDHIKKDSKYAKATNIIWAYRLYDDDKDTYITNSDDGDEYLAGKRLQLLLEKIKVSNVVAIATCWQGDEYLYLDINKNIHECFLKLLMSYGKVENKTQEEIAVFLEKLEAYFQKKKQKLAFAAYEAMKETEPETPKTEFEIIHGEIIPDRKNKFQAHIAQVTSQEQVEQVLEQLKRDSKIAKATYNMLAYRIYVKEKKSFLEEGRDDGENEAGKRLLHLLQMSNVEDAVVIVTRWHSGVHIGPDRFKHINACALEVIKMATEQGIITTGSGGAAPVETKKKGKAKGKRKS